MLRAVNALLLIDMCMLSALVIYSLMLSDVNEQTYQFAMMRALGFQKNHVLVFVVLQAFSFAIPGVLLGLTIAIVLNEGFEEFMFIALNNAGTYGITAASIISVVILFGFLLPICSIVGPTREALGKNLRASLDPSIRNGANESVSATVKQF